MKAAHSRRGGRLRDPTSYGEPQADQREEAKANAHHRHHIHRSARALDRLWCRIERPNPKVVQGDCRLIYVNALLAKPVYEFHSAGRVCQGRTNSQSNWLVNYAKRYRAGLRVGTSVTEGTANFLVNRRMNKSQQMRWSRTGADLLLQVRCAVYNGVFSSGLGHLFAPISNPAQPVSE
jgi:hypothetical protein